VCKYKKLTRTFREATCTENRLHSIGAIYRQLIRTLKCTISTIVHAHPRAGLTGADDIPIILVQLRIVNVLLAR